MAELDIIISKCKKGNRAAQKQLYYLSKDRLRSIALRYCKSTEDAKDVIQEAYLKIFRHLHQYDSRKGNFSAWSARIVINQAFLLYRKDSKLMVDYPEVLPDGKAVLEPESEFNMEHLQKLIGFLKPVHKLVINMHYFDKLSFSEMSELLGIKESSVRSKLTRAKAELRTYHSKIKLDYGS